MDQNNILAAVDLWNSEFNLILMRLEQVHAAFRFLVDNNRPCFDDKCPTACVAFDSDMKFLSWHINPEFWISLPNMEARVFVLCHETYHVFFEHGRRMKNLNHKIANIAEDIVINQMLVEHFFDKNVIDPENMFCWYDNCLAHIEAPYETNREFEYYYDLLYNNECIGSYTLIGNHSDEGLSSDDINDISKSINDAGIPMNDLPSYKGGSLVGSLVKQMSDEYVKPKRKWESVIKKWCANKLKQTVKDLQHWVGKDRRMALLDNKLMIPSTMEHEDKLEVKDKIGVWFYLDTSGSCMNLSKRFFRAAKSLPEDKFDVRLFCFDTRVYETTLKSGKLYGFGGTSFSILEDKISHCIKVQNIKYPDAVFVITDGAGDYVNPKHPDRWYWFLSQNYRHYIPKNSKTFMLKDFE